jgi:hypothetical protein
MERLAFVVLSLVMFSCNTSNGPQVSGLKKQAIWAPDTLDKDALFTVSPDNKNIAAVVKRGDKNAFLVNGKEIAVHDKINTYTDLTFSLESPFSGALESTQTKVASFSQEGGHVAFVARKHKTEMVVIDGKEGPPYARVFLPVFSREGKRVAYEASPDGNKRVIIADGVAGDQYDDIAEGPLFSPDGAHLAYRAELNNRFFVVLDGTRGRSYHHPGGRWSMTFSPDGRRFVYEAHMNDRHFLVDGTSEIPGDGYIDLITFSSNSSRLAYNQGGALILDGKTIGRFNQVEKIVFGADSKHLVVAVVDSGRTALVRDGVIHKMEDEWMDWNTLEVSPDGNRVAYAAKRKNAWVAIADGLAPQPSAESVGPFVFSSDSKHLAFLSSSGKKVRVVTDGMSGPEWDEVRHLAFSPNCAFLVYTARIGGAWKVIANDREIFGCDELVPGTHLVFDGPQSLCMICNESGTFYAVSVTL